MYVNGSYVVINSKDYWNPKEKCTLPRVQTAKKRHRYHSNQQKEDQYIVVNVYQNIAANEDFKLKYA